MNLITFGLNIVKYSYISNNISSYIFDNIVQIVLVLIISLIILYTLIPKIKSLFTEKSDKIDKILKNESSVSIIMHNNPDPDAMGSAIGFRELVNSIDSNIETEILYPGRISHHENRAFRAVLDVEFNIINKKEDINGDIIVLVDHSEIRGIEGVCDEVKPDIIIDHHSENEISSDCNFCYSNDNMGACSTIITELLDEKNILEENLNEKVATALYYGIKSDTNELNRNVSDADFRSINKLYPYVNSEMLKRISNPKIDSKSLETKARAIMGRDVREPFAVSDVGEVENYDSIPQAAEELVVLEGISSVIIIGDLNDKIKFSGRAYDDRIHLGQSLEKLVEDIDGSSAGGHANMAGGTIPKDHISENNITRQDIIEDIFDIMNGRK